jgi:hypothetical protein
MLCMLLKKVKLGMRYSSSDLPVFTSLSSPFPFPTHKRTAAVYSLPEWSQGATGRELTMN